jgi:hypothetical protein
MHMTFSGVALHSATKKICSGLLFFALVANACLVNAATLVHSPVSLPNTGGLSLQAPIEGQQTMDLIDKVNEYAYAQLLIDSGEAARNHFNDRIHWEFHLGAAGALYPGSIGALPDYQDGATGTYGFFTAGVKYNLNNPKMVNAYDVLGELKRLDNLLQVRTFPFSEEMRAECKRMIAEDQAYIDDFWFKRWSVGIDFPYLTRGYTYGQQSWIYPNSSTNNQVYTNTNYGGTYAPGFDFSNPFFFVGTDFGDVLTLKLGFSAHDQVMLGLSTDISTVMFTLGQDFFNYIKSFSGAPSASGLTPNTH